MKADICSCLELGAAASAGKPKAGGTGNTCWACPEVSLNVLFYKPGEKMMWFKFEIVSSRFSFVSIKSRWGRERFQEQRSTRELWRHGTPEQVSGFLGYSAGADVNLKLFCPQKCSFHQIKPFLKWFGSKSGPGVTWCGWGWSVPHLGCVWGDISLVNQGLKNGL